MTPGGEYFSMILRSAIWATLTMGLRSALGGPASSASPARSDSAKSNTVLTGVSFFA